MLLKDITLSSPEENIIYDEVLLRLAEAGRNTDVIRFWESDTLFAVLGQIGKEQEDLKLDQIRKDSIPVLRRCSGGGTVLQGPGCLNYSLILCKEKNRKLADLRRSYEYISERVISALSALSVDAVFQPISDIALAENLKKFSGNAQKRTKNYLLHHGTILYHFDLSLIERYLTMPAQVPEYRRGRGHLDFVTNVPVTRTGLKEEIAAAFEVNEREKTLTKKELDCFASFQPSKPVVVKI